MTEPKTSESEFDYSSINVMAIGVMTAIAIMIFFFFFFVAALALSQPKAGDSVPKQELHYEKNSEKLFIQRPILHSRRWPQWRRR